MNEKLFKESIINILSFYTALNTIKTDVYLKQTAIYSFIDVPNRRILTVMK